MKKLLFCAMLAAAVLFSFGGCSGGQGANSPSDDDAQGNLPAQGGNQSDNSQEDDEENMIRITVNGISANILTEQNAATDALFERLKGGTVSYTADDYGGFEKVGALGFSLPAENRYVTAEAGDVMLYQGNQLVIFYGQNGWQYTPIGRIEGLSQAQLEELLCAGQGEITVNLSL